MKRLLILAVTLFVSCKSFVSCIRKSLQGPPTQDPTLLKEGYIRGYVSGKSEGAIPFRIDYNYAWYSRPLSATATRLNANRIKFKLRRTDSIDLGHISLEFTWNINTNAISGSSISGLIAAQQKGGHWLAYRIPSEGILRVYNVQYQNGRLKGKFRHIHPAYKYNVFDETNTYPDTLRGEFDVKLDFQVVSG